MWGERSPRIYCIILSGFSTSLHHIQISDLPSSPSCILLCPLPLFFRFLGCPSPRLPSPTPLYPNPALRLRWTLSQPKFAPASSYKAPSTASLSTFKAPSSSFQHQTQTSGLLTMLLHLWGWNWTRAAHLSGHLAPPVFSSSHQHPSPPLPPSALLSGWSPAGWHPVVWRWPG